MTPQARQRLLILSFTIAVLLMAISSAWIGIQVQAFREFQMDRDESVHANRGLDIVSAVNRGSLSDLWAETIKPDWYPPFYGYLLGAWFGLVGPSVTTARLFATLCYFLFGLVLWLSAKQAFPKINPILYLIPTLLLVSDDQHVVNAALSMLELTAILFAMASIYFFVKSLDKPSWGNFFLTSVFAVLCFMTRYSHGLFLLATLAICTLFFLTKQFKGRFWQLVATWLPAAIFFFAWLIILGQWRWLKAYADVQQQPTSIGLIDTYLYYPKQLFAESSGWLPILLIAIAVVFWIRRRTIPQSTIPYIVFFIVSLAGLSFRAHNIARFGMVLFPPLWIIATDGAEDLLSLIKKPKLQTVTAVGLMVVLVLLALKNNYTLPARLNFAYENTNTAVNDAYQFIADTLHTSDRKDLNLVMYGEIDNWNAFALHFFLQSQCMLRQADCQILVTDESVITKGWPREELPDEVIEQRTQQALDAADYIVLFTKEPVIPDGWAEIVAKEFEFERYRVNPTRRQVVILERK